MAQYNFQNEQVTTNNAGQVQSTAQILPGQAKDSSGAYVAGTNVQTASPQVIAVDNLSTPAQQPLNVQTPNYNGLIAGANSAIAGNSVANKALADYQNYLDTYNSQNTKTKEQNTLDKYLADLLGAQEATLGKTAAQLQEQNNLGVPDLRKQMATINADALRQVEEYNVIQSQFDKAYQDLNSQPLQLSSIVGTKQQELLRTQSAVLNEKAAQNKLTIARGLGVQGQIESAIQIATEAVNLRYAQAEELVKVRQSQIETLMKSGILDRQERLQAEARQASYNAEQQRLEEAKAKAKENLNLAFTANVQTPFVNRGGEFFDARSGQSFFTPEEFFKASGVRSFEEAYSKGLVSDINAQRLADIEFVQQARNKYPQLGINFNDSPEQVASKIRAYEASQIRMSGGGTTPNGIAGLYIIDANTDAEVKAIIQQRPGDGGWGNTYDAIAKKYGNVIADKYNGVLDNIFRLGASVDGAFNNMKFQGGEIPNNYKGALDIILGSDKFTKEQKTSITNSIVNGEDPFSVIKNQAKNIMGQTNATKLDNYETAKAQLVDIQSALNDYYANGGKTGVFKGSYEKTINRLGEVKDPKLVEITTRIQSALQIYRNAVSGTAYSVQEGRDIASIFPGINKSQGLNIAILNGRMAAFDTTIDSTYRNVLGQSYDQIKNSSGEITVIRKSDGAVGTIPANEFDSNLYERIQ